MEAANRLHLSWARGLRAADARANVVRARDPDPEPTDRGTSTWQEPICWSLSSRPVPRADRGRVRKTTDAIIAEERSKNHHVLADRLTRAAANGEGSPRAGFVGRGRAWRRFATELVPRRRVEDLVLSDANGAACRDLIEEQRRASVLRAHSLEPRHRVLLVGPPGNGKTTLAEAIAEALSVPFIVVRYETMIGSYLGETASRLKRVIDYARTTPSVLFFDEFDAVAKERGDHHETGEIKRVVTSLLMQVDQLPSYTVTVAATNHPELLDRAVWAPVPAPPLA